MITEHEIATIVEIKEINDKIDKIKETFLSHEAPLYTMSNHDFLSLILLTPHVGLALANGSVSLFEELGLNKKARKFSKGGTFLSKDPVVHAMNWLIKDYESWEDSFLEVIKFVMQHTFDMSHLKTDEPIGSLNVENDFHRLEMKAPYIFVKFLRAFFLTDGDEMSLHRKIDKIEYEKLLELGKKLGLDKIAIFDLFCKTFEVK